MWKNTAHSSDSESIILFYANKQVKSIATTEKHAQNMLLIHSFVSNICCSSRLNELMLHTNCLCAISGWIAKICEMHSIQLLLLDSTKPISVCLCVFMFIHVWMFMWSFVLCTLCVHLLECILFGDNEDLLYLVCYNFCKTMSCKSLTWNDSAWKIILKLFFNFMHTLYVHKHAHSDKLHGA